MAIFQRGTHPQQRKTRIPLSAILEAAGGAACFVWEEFFTSSIRNPHTRRAYAHAVRRFLAWAESQRLELAHITLGQVGQYLDQLTASIPTQKQHLAAIRGFFDARTTRLYDRRQNRLTRYSNVNTCSY